MSVSGGVVRERDAGMGLGSHFRFDIMGKVRWSVYVRSVADCIQYLI